ncbi:MAG: class I SAM-dependent DNA methyltransferase [Chloroflexota bacterium]
MTTAETGTWHHGLVARWWAEFNVAEPGELGFYRSAIRRFGEPALDLACGTGRLLRPLLAEGVEVEGADISADMLALCEEHARRDGLQPVLHRHAMHELDLPKRYRTIYICDSFGIGGSRPNDLETLRRVRRHLAPGGTLVFNMYLPFDGHDAESWGRWLPDGRASIPRPWPEAGERRTTTDGDEIELISRLADLDPLLQRHTLEMRARLWHDGKVVADEEHLLLENLYFLPEILLMLDVAGFGHVEVEAGYTGREATRDDSMLAVIARPGAAP